MLHISQLEHQRRGPVFQHKKVFFVTLAFAFLLLYDVVSNCALASPSSVYITVSATCMADVCNNARRKNVCKTKKNRPLRSSFPSLVPKNFPAAPRIVSFFLFIYARAHAGEESIQGQKKRGENLLPPPAALEDDGNSFLFF